MTNTFQPNTPSDITAEACAWIAQLESGELTAADLDAFREWIGRSPSHAAQIKQLAAMSKDMNVLTGMVEPIQEAANEHRVLMSPRAIPAFGLRRLATMAVAVCVLVVGVFFFQQSQTSDVAFFVTTAVGEYQDVQLPDGSIVKLNTNSKIEVSYSKHQRKVRLLVGEAFFDVMPNAERPFFVYADEKQVRVVGTAFLVRLIDKEFELMVTKGRVELGKASALPAASSAKAVVTVPPEPANTSTDLSVPVALVAGQSITLAEIKSAPIVSVSKREQQRELSWQEGLHDFSKTRLEDVINELSRHTTLTIEITDPSLRDLQFGGIFRIGDTAALFGALETSFGIQVSTLNNNTVRLSRQYQ
jgi:transmembrane sensor